MSDFGSLLGANTVTVGRLDGAWPLPGCCNNFPYGFKGALCAPRGLAAGHAKAPRTNSTVPNAAHRLSVTGWAPSDP